MVVETITYMIGWFLVLGRINSYGCGNDYLHDWMVPCTGQDQQLWLWKRLPT